MGLATFAIAVQWLAAQQAAAVAQPLATGVTNIGEEPLLAFERVKQSGAQFIRIPLYWSGTAPQAKPGDPQPAPDYGSDPAPQEQPSSWQPTDPFDPSYGWQASDEDVNRAVQAGLTPVLQIEGAPSWAQRCRTPASLDGAICDPDPAALSAFATAAARRYSGRYPGLPRVQYWQALNEPNLSIFFFPQFSDSGQPLSPGLYRALVNATSAGVKSVDPTNLVVAAGLGPIAVPPWTIGPMRFARLLLCMSDGRHPRPVGGDCGGGVHFDIFAIHPYTTGGPTHEGKANDVELGDLKKLHNLLAAADRAGRIVGSFRHTPLWVTEFSWDSKPPDPGGLPMRIETRWVAEALYRAWSAGVSNFFWYSLRDAPSEPHRAFNETLQSGLYFRGPSLAQDTPKPMLQAFRFPFVSFPRAKGLFFWGRTPNSRGGRVAVQIWTGKRWRRVSMAKAGKAGIFRGVVPIPYGEDRQGSVRAVFRKHVTAGFSMRPVPDFRHPPFG